MLSKIFILNFIILTAESKTIIKANEKNFPSFVSLTDGKEPLKNTLRSSQQRHHYGVSIFSATFWFIITK